MDTENNIIVIDDAASTEEKRRDDERAPKDYHCYLLQSCRPNCEKKSYVGSTNNLPRRLRQHNGEICNGAGKTIKLRPLRLVCQVSGFLCKNHARVFEWAWQHPRSSKMLQRHRAAVLGRRKVLPIGSWRISDAIRALKVLIEEWNNSHRETLFITWYIDTHEQFFDKL